MAIQALRSLDKCILLMPTTEYSIVISLTLAAKWNSNWNATLPLTKGNIWYNSLREALNCRVLKSYPAFGQPITYWETSKSQRRLDKSHSVYRSRITTEAMSETRLRRRMLFVVNMCCDRSRLRNVIAREYVYWIRIHANVLQVAVNSA